MFVTVVMMENNKNNNSGNNNKTHLLDRRNSRRDRLILPACCEPGWGRVMVDAQRRAQCQQSRPSWSPLLQQHCPPAGALPRQEPFALLPLPSVSLELPFSFCCSRSGRPCETSLPAPPRSQKTLQGEVGSVQQSTPPPKPFARQQTQIRKNPKVDFNTSNLFQLLRADDQSCSLLQEMLQMHVTGNSHSLSPSQANPPIPRKATFALCSFHSWFESQPSLEEPMLMGRGRAVTPGARNWSGKAVPKGKGTGNAPGQAPEATEASAREFW